MTEEGKTIVNSWNEWDPLKHVIVGVADGCTQRFVHVGENGNDRRAVGGTEVDHRFGQSLRV